MNDLQKIRKSIEEAKEGQTILSSSIHGVEIFLVKKLGAADVVDLKGNRFFAADCPDLYSDKRSIFIQAPGSSSKEIAYWDELLPEQQLLFRFQASFWFSPFVGALPVVLDSAIYSSRYGKIELFLLGLGPSERKVFDRKGNQYTSAKSTWGSDWGSLFQESPAKGGRFEMDYWKDLADDVQNLLRKIS